MFDWLFKRKPKCVHFKRAGQKHPENMITVYVFSESVKYANGHSIDQCCICGVRAFGTSGHWMSDEQISAVNSFIEYKMSDDEFIAVFKKKGWIKTGHFSDNL